MTYRNKPINIPTGTTELNSIYLDLPEPLLVCLELYIVYKSHPPNSTVDGIDLHSLYQQKYEIEVNKITSNMLLEPCLEDLNNFTTGGWV